jgi:two-component system, chemotaxis family, sensor kinase CheA
MDELFSDFLTETFEHIARLDLELVRLETEPDDPALLSGIFRLMHTIKGTSGFLGLARLESLAHASETLLGQLRERTRAVDAALVTLILRSLDRIKALLAALEATGAEPAGDDRDLIAALEACAAGAGALPLPSSADAVPEAAEETMTETTIPERPAAELTPVAPLPAGTGVDSSGKAGGLAAQSVRVHVDLLEKLMTGVSELVLTRNQLLQTLRAQKESAFTAPLQRLNQVVSELQEDVMRTRMQPIGNAWQALPRLIRDLAADLGKKIALELHGAETELDKQVFELIKDPLTHMVRNSADHGLEKPAERAALGKPETGRIVLEAYHEGGYVVVVIRDDGRGLDIERIRAKAIAQGLASEAETAGLSEAQLLHFIFRPGFSTAEKVTAVSGRGVGMDVVRTNIERIGGTIDVRSKRGAGTSFIVRIPLTLAIISALIVGAAGERFAIPQLAVTELVQVGTDQAAEHRIEIINGAPLLRLRQRLLPVIVLKDLLRLGPEKPEAESARHFVVVARIGTQDFGIMVDRVFDTEEIVVKPVAPVLRGLAMFSGNTILGDGSVIMILDPNGMDIAASRSAETAGATGTADAGSADIAASRATSMLIFRAGDATPKAVSLSLVARIEEVAVEAIERIEEQRVIQYRGQLMPLVGFDGAAEPRGKTQKVLVFVDEARCMGLCVDEILDITEVVIDIKLGSAGGWRLGSTVIGGKAADLVDAGYFLTKALPGWFGRERQETSGRGLWNLLLVDDSPFFRSVMTPLLEAAGFNVTALGDARDALAMRERGTMFDAIISDIEMPGMTGFEFVAEVKSDPRWADIPIMALSSLSTPRDVDRGRGAGFDDYIVKSDRNSVVRRLTDRLTLASSAA